MAVLDDIAIKLVTDIAGFGKLSGTTGNVARGTNLDVIQPSDAIALYDSQGLPSEQTFSTGNAVVAFENAGLQILTRSTSYKTARTNAVLAYQVLDGFTGTLSGTKYLSIDAAQPPFFIGRDERNRPLFSCNFNIRKETT